MCVTSRTLLQYKTIRIIHHQNTRGDTAKARDWNCVTVKTIRLVKFTTKTKVAHQLLLYIKVRL